jgi:hypothetical protein
VRQQYQGIVSPWRVGMAAASQASAPLPQIIGKYTIEKRRLYTKYKCKILTLSILLLF